VLLYAYAIGVRSSRQIQRRCIEDLAFRVLAGNQLPDHVTIARFRVRHQQALAGFLVESLKLCAAAGLDHLGLIALDGTKVAANAADRANRTLAKLQTEVDQILREVAETDQAEDRQHGPARGDELTAELASPSGRLARLHQAKLRSEAGKARYATRKQTVEPVFGQLKEQESAGRFLRRGLTACDAEWKLLCGAHNLLKLWRHTHRHAAPTPLAI
jgi:hypothetical protein